MKTLTKSKKVDLSKIKYRTWREPVNVTPEQFNLLQIEGIQKAIKDADNGRLISNKAVFDWIESLNSQTPLPIPTWKI